MNRNGTERIGEGVDVVVLGGEHGDEEQADRVVAHALKQVQVVLCLRRGAISLVSSDKQMDCELRNPHSGMSVVWSCVFLS